jgi:pimeloyl-ACP methyl ester carboxylesterase
MENQESVPQGRGVDGGPRGDRRVRTDGFTRRQVEIDGCEVVYYEAGEGPPLLFFHGGGTFHGLDFARDWTRHHRVILPYHPNFGASEDNPRITAMHHYVQAYIAFCDQLGLQQLDLVGLSFGGQLAATFALYQQHRIRRLVLGAPAGIYDPAHPPSDLSVLPPEEVLARLVHDMATLMPYLPQGFDADFVANRGREFGAASQVLSNEQASGLDLARWLPRLRSTPSLVLWGNGDRIFPAALAERWGEALGATVQRFEEVGHLVFDESAAVRHAVTAFLSAP